MDMNMIWDANHINLAMKIVMERFALNSVAGHFAPPIMEDKMATTALSNRFDFKNRIVVDGETINLHEPFATCNFTLAQVSEFASMTGASLTGEMAMQIRMVTTITRAASALARWHDVLFFVGIDQKQLPPGVEPGTSVGNPEEVGSAFASRYTSGKRCALWEWAPIFVKCRAERGFGICSL